MSKQLQGFWAEMASRFVAIDATVDLVAHQTPDNRWRLKGPIIDKNDFIALGKLCLSKLGQPVSSDEEALQRWIERLCTELPGMEDYNVPPDGKTLKVRVCRGINHLAASLCRRHEIEERIHVLAKDDTTPTRFPRRATWLQKILSTRDETAYRFAGLHGIDPKTVKKVLNGEPVQDAVLNRLAVATGCPAQEIPSE